MPYVGAPFVFDIFISYSHGSDGMDNAYLQPWSAAFARELERELRADRKFRHDLRIFLDHDFRPGLGIDPMSPLTEQLREQIGASALLLILMSPDYLASSWCADERNWWSARQTELGLPIEERIAVVKIWPTDEPWPAALNDSRGNPLVGFPFYAQADVPPRPLGWTEQPGPFGSEFRKALLGIVGRLYPKLDEMKARVDELQRAKAAAAKLASAGGQSIYLHGRLDHAQAWERAALELTSNGFAVVPGEPDPVEQDPQKLQTIRERRVEALSGCDALLLLGTDDTRALDADLVVVGKHDRQSARARANHLLPCGLLDTVGPPIATAVRKATARIVQADWIDGTQTPWTPAIHRWLVDRSRQAEQP
jgi:hypothetical protein